MRIVQELASYLHIRDFWLGTQELKVGAQICLHDRSDMKKKKKKQFLGELRVVLQKGWSGQHHRSEAERGGRKTEGSQEGSSEEMFGQRKSS